VENLLWRGKGSRLLQIRTALDVSLCLLFISLKFSHFKVTLHAAATVIGRLHLVTLPGFSEDLANLLNIIIVSFLTICYYSPFLLLITLLMLLLIYSTSKLNSYCGKYIYQIIYILPTDNNHDFQ
jgi:hypothetical protein